MKYGSLEWAQDLLNSTKAELDKINAADDKGKAAAEGLGLTNYYTGLVKALEDEIAKGNYVTEKEMPAGQYKSENEMPANDTSNVSNIASAITSNDLGRSFSMTAEDEDSDGDTDKLTIEEEDKD